MRAGFCEGERKSRRAVLTEREVGERGVVKIIHYRNSSGQVGSNEQQESGFPPCSSSSSSSSSTTCFSSTPSSASTPDHVPRGSAGEAELVLPEYGQCRHGDGFHLTRRLRVALFVPLFVGCCRPFVRSDRPGLGEQEHQEKEVRQRYPPRHPAPCVWFSRFEWGS